MRKILGLCLVLVLLFWGGEAQAGALADRIVQFPNWENKPPVTVAEGDLIYPDWMAGTWKVTSTLVEQVAPLAPDVVTPGFESNRRYLNQPVSFLVRFQAVSNPPSTISDYTIDGGSVLRFFPLTLRRSEPSPSPLSPETPVVVADRAFNGLNIAKAYLGDTKVQSVKVDPDSPNRQITSLRSGRQLVSIVTSRASEIPAPDRFIATEVSNQIFRGIPQPYLNQVETTTAYQLKRSPSVAIDADQVTAIYLSPQDPNYFNALERPVALYRYRLELVPIESTVDSSPT
ncbi:MAG TPA: hypothetical protein V6C91_01895 [Coleofasciculaceae cyanobacterium]